MARGRNLRMVGPSSACTALTYRSSPTSSWLFSALATAESSSLLQSRAIARGVRARIARASSTDLPRMWSHTSRALRAEDRTYLAWARTTGAGRFGSRRDRRRDPTLPAPVVRAQAKYVRSSARKARLVCDHIRGKSVEEARAILALTPRAIARDWSKLLESAVANAEHNHELVGEDLYIKAVHADQGPTIRRFRPRAMGRATRIRKRTSHLTILLTPKE